MILLLIGQMRTWRNNIILNSYKKYFDKFEKIDLYIFTWNKSGYSNRHGNPNLNQQMNDTINYNDVYNYYNKLDFINIKYIYIEDFDSFLNSLDISLKNIYNMPFGHHSKVSTCIPIQYKYQQAISYLSKIPELDRQSNIIVTRPDVCFCNEQIELDIKENTVYYESMCKGCIDHCWYGKVETIIKQLNDIYSNYIINYKKIIPEKHARDNNFMLIYMCEQKNIKLIFNKKAHVSIIYY